MGHNWNRKQQREQMIEKESEGVSFLAFPAFKDIDFIRHGFSTRLGGVSEGKFSTMNLTFTRGDNPDHVMENYQRIGKAIQVDPKQMVLSYQTHTTNVRVVTKEDAGKGLFIERDYQDTDGLITNVPGLVLVTFYADCVPLYLVDPVNRGIGLSHSGWRGTVNRIGKATIDAMSREYGSRPEDLIACIGPSICQDCFEVGEDVVVAFRKAFDPRHWSQLSYRKENGKHQLDLWKANSIVLEEAGVAPDRIHITDICTHCNPDLLFSHRTTGNERGNLAAFLALC